MRYVGRRAGLAGRTAAEEARVDMARAGSSAERRLSARFQGASGTAERVLGGVVGSC